MRDYNFFQPYLSRGKGRGQSDDQFPYVLFVLLLIIAVAALPAYNYYRLMELDAEVDRLSTSVLNDPNYGLLSEVSTAQGIVNNARANLATLQQIDTNLTGAEWIREPFLEAVTGVFPRDVAMRNLTISPSGQVQITGEATNKPAIAELQLNLRNTGHFTNLHVPTISRGQEDGGGTFSFVLLAQVKGVGANAGN
jgi:hypothetical protein